MTELLHGEAEVRLAGSRLAAVRTAVGWRRVDETVVTWRVETDWWRLPVARDYVRCVLDGGDCVELYRDRMGGGWWWSRRYD